MRRIFVLAAASAALCVGSFVGPAAAGPAGNAGLASAAAGMAAIEQVARVCRERCENGFCKKTCVVRPGGNVGFVERRRFRRDFHRDRHHHRDRPGLHIELR